MSENPKIAARDLCNKHVVKMILESAQLLCAAASINKFDNLLKCEFPYKLTHLKHPCTLWVVQSYDNFSWLCFHFEELCLEYTRRYGKKHKTEVVMKSFIEKTKNLGDWKNHTAFVQVMPNDYKNSCAITAYKCYYIAEKYKFAKWQPRANPPSWWPFEENVK